MGNNVDGGPMDWSADGTVSLLGSQLTPPPPPLTQPSWCTHTPPHDVHVVRGTAPAAFTGHTAGMQVTESDQRFPPPPPPITAATATATSAPGLRGSGVRCPLAGAATTGTVRRHWGGKGGKGGKGGGGLRPMTEW